jgi:cysteinyl-tRNA synthetase
VSDELGNMPLQIYNTLTGQKEPFKPVHEGRTSLYVCGPTVYSDSHLGHAKTYVSFDIILRYLRYCGFKTFYVQNITDVGHLLGDDDEGEDKLLKRARELEQEPMAVAENFARRHFEVMDRLGVIRPDISPRATGHIPEQLEAIEKLIELGLAYEANGSVYFDISKDPKYGELSNRIVEEMQGGARVEVRSEKRHPGDFALWKRAESGHLMRWRDPYSGWGYPGWHTECVVMSTRYLGEEFDIHGGGMDLKFPHHECEIAQARGLAKPFARNWMHSNMLTIEGQKNE